MVVAASRMNRAEFYARTAPLDAEQLRKALWTVYWRGSAQLRERIEETLEPAKAEARKRAAAEPPDPGLVLDDVTEFAGLARSGAYLGGDRRVTPKERTRWRTEFRRLASDALAALRAEDPGPAEEALADLIDLACETREHEYFRSEDPMEAAQFVVSDAAATLWELVRERHGFARFAELAAAQLPRWESAYGWSRSGWGKLAGKETTLASVLGRMLRAPDAWTAFAGRYLDALEKIASAELRRNPRASHGGCGRDSRRQRTDNLAQWHALLLERLAGSDAEALLDRLAGHRALGGPGLIFVQAQLAHLRGQDDQARKLIGTCLRELPGHDGYADFAVQVGAELPAGTRERLAERARMQAAADAG